jgi:hypothetical protein
VETSRPSRSNKPQLFCRAAGARLDHWSIDDGHLFEETIATGAVLGSIERATPRTLWIGIRLR